MKLSLKKILEAGGMYGRHTNVDQAGKKIKYQKPPEEFPEVFGGPCKAYIENNHGHILKISIYDIQDKSDMTYNIQGSSDHNHTIKLSSDDFEKLEQEGNLKTTSSKDEGHDHVIMLKCN